MERPSLALEPPMDGRRRTAHELVRDALRHAILRGLLPGGTRLVQSDIAAALDVSTTPVREAMRDLATEGLIRLDAHRGAIVYELDAREVEEVYFLRKLLEPEAMRRAAQCIEPDELARGWQLCDQMDAESDPDAWADLNTSFHDLIVRAARLPRLVAMIDTLRASSAPYIALAVRMHSEQFGAHNKHHRRILGALEAGDGQGAAEAVIEHLEATLEVLAGSVIARP